MIFRSKTIHVKRIQVGVLTDGRRFRYIGSVRRVNEIWAVVVHVVDVRGNHDRRTGLQCII